VAIGISSGFGAAAGVSWSSEKHETRVLNCSVRFSGVGA